MITYNREHWELHYNREKNKYFGSVNKQVNEEDRVNCTDPPKKLNRKMSEKKAKAKARKICRPPIFFCHSAVLNQCEYIRSAILEYKCFSEKTNFVCHQNGPGCGNFMTLEVPIFYKDVMSHFLWYLHSGRIIAWPDISRSLKFFAAIIQFGLRPAGGDEEIDYIAKQLGFKGFYPNSEQEEHADEFPDLEESDRTKIFLSRKYIFDRLLKEYSNEEMGVAACPGRNRKNVAKCFGRLILIWFLQLYL